MSCPGAAPRGANVSRSDDSAADRTLSRASRLRARKQFLEVYERGYRVPSAYFVVFGLPGSTRRSRLGITATKKCGPAVVRNRVRRVVREIFRRHRSSAEAPVDVVVNVRTSAVGQPFERLESDLVSGLRALHRRLDA